MGTCLLILLALIVNFFSGRGDRQLEYQVSQLRSIVNDLKKANARQTGGLNQPQEHPGEHPQEHPAGRQQPGLTKDALADAIQNYVKNEALLKGGFLLIFDKDAGQTLTPYKEQSHAA